MYGRTPQFTDLAHLKLFVYWMPLHLLSSCPSHCCALSFCEFTVRDPHINEVMLYSSCTHPHLTQHNVPQVHPCCCKWQNFLFVFFNRLNNSLCVIHLLFIRSSVHGHLCCSHGLATVINAAVDTGVQMPQDQAFHFFKCSSTGGNARSCADSIFNFWRHSHFVFCSSYTIF